MGISKGVVELQLAAGDPDLCRDKAVELLKEGNATQSAEWCVPVYSLKFRLPPVTPDEGTTLFTAMSIKVKGA